MERYYKIRKDKQITGKIKINFHKTEDCYIWEYFERSINDKTDIKVKLNLESKIKEIFYNSISNNTKITCKKFNSLNKYYINNKEYITRKNIYLIEMFLFLPSLFKQDEILLFEPISNSFSQIDFAKFDNKFIIKRPKTYIVNYQDNIVNLISDSINNSEIILI